VTSEIQQTRYDRLVRRVANIIGPGSKVGEVISDLFPMIDVENLPAELYRLMGTQLVFGGGTIVGAGGQVPNAQIFNPADSNTLITVTSFVVAAPFDATLRYGRDNFVLSTLIGTQSVRDTRADINEASVGVIAQESRVALAPGTMQCQLIANQTLIISDPNDVIVLAPGTGLTIGTIVATGVLFYGFNWRERPAEQAELLV